MKLHYVFVFHGVLGIVPAKHSAENTNHREGAVYTFSMNSICPY